MRYIAERLFTISRELEREFYSNSKLSRRERFLLSANIQEIRAHVEAIYHYAPQVMIEYDTFPRTLKDYADKDFLPF